MLCLIPHVHLSEHIHVVVGLLLLLRVAHHIRSTAHTTSHASTHVHIHIHSHWLLRWLLAKHARLLLLLLLHLTHHGVGLELIHLWLEASAAAHGSKATAAALALHAATGTSTHVHATWHLHQRAVLVALRADPHGVKRVALPRVQQVALRVHLGSGLLLLLLQLDLILLHRVEVEEPTSKV